MNCTVGCVESRGPHRQFSSNTVDCASTIISIDISKTAPWHSWCVLFQRRTHHSVIIFRAATSAAQLEVRRASQLTTMSNDYCEYRYHDQRTVWHRHWPNVVSELSLSRGPTTIRLRPSEPLILRPDSPSTIHRRTTTTGRKMNVRHFGRS